MDYLTLASSATQGLDKFGESMQYQGAAAAYGGSAELLDVQQQFALYQGERQAKQVSIKGDKFIARQRALYSKAGVRFTGSPALVWAESEKNLRMDILTTKLNASMKASEIGFKAVQMRMAAGQAKTRAILAQGQGVTNLILGAGKAMGGASSATKGGVNVRADGSGGASGMLGDAGVGEGYYLSGTGGQTSSFLLNY